MDVRGLECFVAVARHRHFTRAADELYLTQSAVSQQVRRLEAQLGTPLFERGTPITLTAAGEELLPRAIAVLRSLDDARAAVTGAAVGTVRLSAEHPEGVAPAVAAFHAAHPAVRVSFEGGDVYVGGAAPSGWSVVSRRSEPLVVVGFDDAVVEVQSLRGRPVVLPGRGHPLRVVIDAAFASAGFGAVPVLSASDVSALRALVAAGAGIALVPESWAAPLSFARLTHVVEYDTVVAVRTGSGPAAEALAAALRD